MHDKLVLSYGEHKKTTFIIYPCKKTKIQTKVSCPTRGWCGRLWKIFKWRNNNSTYKQSANHRGQQANRSKTNRISYAIYTLQIEDPTGCVKRSCSFAFISTYPVCPLPLFFVTCCSRPERMLQEICNKQSKIGIHPRYEASVTRIRRMKYNQ